MTLLLWAQVGYAAAGVGYNLVSLAAARRGGRPLHEGSATAGLVVMLAYTVSLGLGFAGLGLAYRAAMVVFLVLIGYGGFWVHLRRAATDYYRSRGARAAAVATNGAGLVLNLAGLITGA